MERFSVMLIVIATASGLALTSQEPAPVPEGVSEEEITEELIARGKELFNRDACNLCHGSDGTGSDMAPDLTDDEWLHSDGDFQDIRRTIWFGVSEDQIKDSSRPYAMNPGGGLDLDSDTLDAVAAYAWSLGHEK